MTSQTLRDARKYEEAMEKNITPEERPAFHLSPRVGWMNDPNGFSFYKGKYHLFYQYYPYDSNWGPMHWGHAVSSDLLHWEFLPAALAPDMPYDEAGCFSGSAEVMPDGRQLLLYTGVRKEVQQNGELRDVQTQCLAIGDGVDYDKFPGNPVIDDKKLPEGSSRHDFRDPKIWRLPDGTYRMVAANNRADESGGRILLYRSADAMRWQFESVLVSNDGSYGKMWECPDFFELDGAHVLLVSPQDMLPRGFEYHNGNGTVCMIGEMYQDTGRFCPEFDQAIDYGIDFYATQTIVTPDGRRVMIAWMQNWDTCNNGHNQKQKWFGQMCLPRELSVRDGRLIQKPVRELEALRTGRVEYKNVAVDGTITLPGIEGRCVDMELVIRPGKPDEDYHKFAVRFAKNDDYQTSVSFRPYESVLKIDRKFSGSRRALIHQRRCKVFHADGELRLRLILDRYSVEIFVNDGEQVMSATLYTELDAKEICFFADGQAEIDVVKYDLKV